MAYAGVAPGVGVDVTVGVPGVVAVGTGDGVGVVARGEAQLVRRLANKRGAIPIHAWCGHRSRCWSTRFMGHIVDLPLLEGRAGAYPNINRVARQAHRTALAFASQASGMCQGRLWFSLVGHLSRAEQGSPH